MTVRPSSDQMYANAADQLAARFEALETRDVLAQIIDLVPASPARIADIGAGTGRDAAWLADQGHEVLAVEPVEALRRIGADRHGAGAIRWVDDRLPALPSLPNGEFDAILAIAVWQHVDPASRPAAITRLAQLLRPGGRLILSLRHGPTEPDWPVWPCNPDETIAAADRSGLALLRRAEAPAVDPANREAGISWTWLAFERNP